MSRQFCRLYGFARDGRRPHTLRMAIDAILHRKRPKGPGRRPLEGFHWAMAVLAFDLRYRYVNLMRKKDVRRQAPDSFPWNFLSLLSVGSDFLYLRAVGISARVTTQTQRRRWSPRNRVLFSALMARRTRETERNVSLMGKRNRLLDTTEYPARPITQGRHSGHNYQDQNNSFHCHPSNHRESPRFHFTVVQNSTRFPQDTCQWIFLIFHKQTTRLFLEAWKRLAPGPTNWKMNHAGLRRRREKQSI